MCYCFNLKLAESIPRFIQIIKDNYGMLCIFLKRLQCATAIIATLTVHSVIVTLHAVTVTSHTVDATSIILVVAAHAVAVAVPYSIYNSAHIIYNSPHRSCNIPPAGFRAYDDSS